MRKTFIFRVFTYPIHSARQIALVCSLFLVILGIYAPAHTNAFSGGSGTEGSPYLIASVADLYELNSYTGSGHVGKYFKLTADINLDVAPYNTGAGWTPISSFYGHIDGDNKTISNLYINTSGGNKGLFASLTGATEVKNLTISNANITASGNYVGILAGAISQRTLTSITVSGTVSNSGVTGGLAGSLSSTTSANDLHSSANVTSSSFTGVGGLIGNMTSATLSDSSSTGTVAGGTYRVGGLVADVDSNSAIYRSYSTGTVSDSSGEIGGLVGALYGDIYDSYSRSTVTSANLSKGGLVGFANNAGASIVRSYATGSMGGSGGGLLGSLYSGSCSSSFWDATTTGRSSSACGTSKTTAQMIDVATFTNTATSTGLSAAWDFTGNPNNDTADSNYWNIDGSTNGGYPFLNGYNANTTPSVTSLGPPNLVSTAWTSDNTPELSFTSADTDGGDTVQYRIQIDDSSNFGSPVVDYTSALATPGAMSFTVGQAAGSGTYTVGSSGQTLSDAQYYWRVKVLDQSAADSGYTAANDGEIAFGIDTTTPTLQSVTPTDNATNVGLANNLSITFSEAVYTNTGNLTIKRSSDGSIVEAIPITSGQIDGDSTSTLTINPSTNFAQGTGYYVEIDNTALFDRAGLYFAGLSGSSSWNFTSHTLTPPVLSSPSSDSEHSNIPITLTVTEAPLADTLKLTFDGTNDYVLQLTNLSPGTHSFSIDPASPLSTAEVAAITGGSTIPDGVYNITASQQDETGAPTMTSSTATNVTIEHSNPALSALTPTNNASGVAVNVQPSLTFSEPMYVGSGDILVRKVSDNSIRQSIPVDGGLVSGEGTSTITIDLAIELDGAVRYYLEVPAGAFVDAGGNEYAGFSGSTSWKFTTAGSSNGKLSVTPKIFSLGEGDHQTIGLTLDEPIIAEEPDPSTVISITSNSSLVSLSTDSITYPSTAWSEARDFTVTAVDDAIVTGDTTVTITLTIASDSEYYNAYTQTVTLTIADNDEPEESAPENTANNSTNTTTSTGGQPAQTSTGTAQPTTSDASDSESTLQIINLESFAEYKTTGKRLSVKKGQVVSFMVKGEEHTATIADFVEDWANITLASAPQVIRLNVGETKKYDVNNDGVLDVAITFRGAVNGLADIVFKHLSAAEVTTPPLAQNTDSEPSTSSNNIMGLVIALVLLIALAVIAKIKRARRANATTSS